MISAPAASEAATNTAVARRRRQIVYLWLIGTALAWMGVRLMFVSGSGGDAAIYQCE